MIGPTKMQMGKCPYCKATVAKDDRGLYHEQPTCPEWCADMAKLPVSYAGRVDAVVVSIEPKPDESN